MNDNNTNILIIGAGPTGLMLACQLLRYGVRFRIVDKQADRAHESRAFAIQAKSMEIFQNLGIDSEFMEAAHTNLSAEFFMNGRKKATIDFKYFKQSVKDTPFPAIFFLSQAETERILIEYLSKHHRTVERQTELLSFIQHPKSVEAQIRNNLTHQIEKIHCDYLVGCDGAHSTVRRTLNLAFEGAAYAQNFILVDGQMDWPFFSDRLLVFFTQKGLLLHVPLDKTISRLMIMQSGNRIDKVDKESLEILTQAFTRSPVKISHIVFLSRFHLHHRGVNHYRKDNCFLAGDAAHIHSPVGGQGMNTGLQDAANLGWKLALVLKKISPVTLLDTYETERKRIGQILLKTTDRFFSFMTSNRFWVAGLRHLFLPFIIKFIFSRNKCRKYLFKFVSQLGIHYHKSLFVDEPMSTDATFNAGPHAGYRAPDVVFNASSLFAILQDKQCHCLIFTTVRPPMALKNLESKYQNILSIHLFLKTVENAMLFKAYGVTTAAIYFIRPDGYIGFRTDSLNFEAFDRYLRVFFESCEK